MAQRIADTGADFVTPVDMLAEVKADNEQILRYLRATYGACDEHGDFPGASPIEA